MGKAQKGKARQRRHHPIRVPDNHLGQGVQAAEDTSEKKGQVLPVLQKLESPDAGDRVWACAAVSNLIQNDASTRRLLQAKGVVEKLITRLSDNEEEVIVEAAGSLRNLCIDGGYDMCGQMFNKNILSPLKSFIPKIVATLREFLGPAPPKVARGLKARIYEFSESVITLFWCLSETSSNALRAINEADLTPFLMAFLISAERIPIKTVVAAAQCLYVLSDDNEPTVKAIRKTPEYVSCLLDIVNGAETASKHEDGMAVDKPSEEEEKVALKVLACGILKNISPIPVIAPRPPIEFEKTIAVPLLVPLLGYSLEDASARVQELVATDEKGSKNLDLTPGTDHKTSAEEELARIESQLRTIALALEIMTTVCAKLPDLDPPSADAGEEEETMDDDVDKFDEDDQMPTETADETPKTTITASQNTTLPLLSQLTQPLLHLARPTALSFPPASSQPIHPPTTSALGTVHIRAFECLNNLFLGMNPDETPLPEGTAAQAVGVWRDVWTVLASVGKQSEWTLGTGGSAAVQTRLEIWEIAVGALWGLARIGKGELVPEAEQVNALIEFCDAAKDEVVKVKCVGTLGCLAQRGDAIEANKMVSTYLFTYLNPPTPTPIVPYPEVTLHAASYLIDIFSDEAKPYDINFRQNNWTAALASSKDRVRRAIKAIDRKKEGGKELRMFGEDVLANLGAFVQYRKRLGV